MESSPSSESPAAGAYSDMPPKAGIYTGAHDEFDSWAQAIEEGIKQAAVAKYSPDQPRADNGEFGSDSSQRPKVSTRVERARKSCVLIGTKEQKIADNMERRLSAALGVPRTADNSAFDLRNDDVGIEVKTLLSNTNGKITMNKYALGRKMGEAQADGLKTFTVVADLRGRSNATYYVTNRLGSLRINSMTKATLSEIRDMVRAV